MKDIIPAAIVALLAWVANFKKQVLNYTTTLNLTTQQVTDLTTSCDNITNAINDTIQAKHEYEVKLNQRDNTIDLEVQKLRLGANLIKLNSSYTDGIGQAFDIIYTPDAPFNPQDYKPVIILISGLNCILIKFTKKGVEGLNLYSRLQGETKWTFLSLCIHSPYNDNRPLADPTKPENREYMAIGVLNDAEIGIQSDIASITFAG